MLLENNVVKCVEQSVAYHADLPGGGVMGVGTTIIIDGYVRPHCSRFAVDLLAGKDVAFHFNPRISQRYIVRNTRTGGEWQEEETASIRQFPFERAQPFRLQILLTEHTFLVAANNLHVCAYDYRLPIVKIHAISVNGEVDIQLVDCRKIDVYPEMQALKQILIVKNVEDVKSESMVLPLTFNLNDLSIDHRLEIHGHTKILPHSFYINLQDSPNIWPHPAIPLHLNLRFGTQMAENVFIRNAWSDGRWGAEERTPNFKFCPGSKFSMAITRSFDQFSVWLNDQLIGEFKIRHKTNKINTLYIQGDLVLNKVILLK